MLLSGNDAGGSGGYVGGSVPRFVSYMNKATMLGA